MILETYTKQPAEFKDYDVNYSEWLANPVDTLFDVVATAECLSTPGNVSLVIDHVDMTTHGCKLWIGGGTANEKYKITLNATTVGGRVDQSELIFKVKDF